MSLTVVQRFYEVAKQAAEAVALRVEYDGECHPLPWWFVKSKAKHFGIGLLEAGASPGDYFYSFPSQDPAWIYAELGALTMGLQSLPLPAELPDESFSRLVERFPPAFLFLGERGLDFLQAWLPKLTRLKRAVSIKEPTDAASPVQSFRKIFNSGIRHEAQHHRVYRSRREGLDENWIVSPIQVDGQGRLEERPLRHGDVNAAAAKLSRATAGVKLRRLFSDVNLSCTADRIACLYWPILLGIESALARRELGLESQLRRLKPEVLCLRESRQRELESFLPALPPGAGKKFSAWLARKKFQTRSGGRLRALLLSETPVEDKSQSFEAVGVRTLVLPKILL